MTIAAELDFAALLQGAPAPEQPALKDPDWLPGAVEQLLNVLADHPSLDSLSPRLAALWVIAEFDCLIAKQVNAILHHPEFQALEASWRGVHFLVRGTDTDPTIKIRLFDVKKTELSATLRKFRGQAWDQSPIFRKIYEEEYGQLGGTPYGLLVGDYQFDHQPEDVLLLSNIAKIAAASHAPFIAGAAPSLMHMTNWQELANSRDLRRIMQTTQHTAWQAMRTDEDSRYLGLCMPRFLGRLPYGSQTDPLDDFAFEEETSGPGGDGFLWINAAYALASNVVRAFALYGWCTRIRGADSGGVVDGLVAYRYDSADGDTDRRCVTEVCLSERREAELSRCGLIPLLHRKNTDFAAFISAQSLQQPASYADPAATANAILAARLPYLFACCRFAHFLKCMIRDKGGATISRTQLTDTLQAWLREYVDGSPSTSSEEHKANNPLEEAHVELEDKIGSPGEYEARFYLRPHYQLEGMSVALRLVSRLSQKTQ